jgi:hypothetical protein
MFQSLHRWLGVAYIAWSLWLIATGVALVA